MPNFSHSTTLSATDFLDLSTTSTSNVTIAACLVLPALLLLPKLFASKSKSGGTIPELGGFHFVSAWQFLTKRYDFVWTQFNAGRKIFKFWVLRHPVVVLSGEEGRKLFFNDKSLHFSEGYRLLMGGVPTLKDIDINGVNEGDTTKFNKNLHKLFNKDRLHDILPTLFEDVNKRMDGWGSEGMIYPFEDVYQLVFQMTVRMASCRELASDHSAVARLSKLYDTLERSASPTYLMFPWFPGKDKKAKEESTKGLYDMLNEYVDMRRGAAVPTSDAIDVLISEGNENAPIVAFMLSVIFAGVVNTGIQSCWILLYLAANPTWKAKVKEEVESLIALHTTTTTTTTATTKTEPLHKRLSSIPLTAWEDSMPILDAVQRETLRLTQSGTALRRNVIEDLKVPVNGNVVIEKGAFLGYNLADVHLNPEIYREPMKFDPDRFGEGRAEDKKGVMSYLGWGAGRHPCTGMKVAKLEIKMIVALFLAGYDFDLADKSGKCPPREFPRLNRNDIHQARPLGDPCFIKFKKVVE